MCLDVLVKYGGRATPLQFGAENLKMGGMVWYGMRLLRRNGLAELRGKATDSIYVLTEAGKIAYAIWDAKNQRARNRRRRMAA